MRYILGLAPIVLVLINNFVLLPTLIIVLARRRGTLSIGLGRLSVLLCESYRLLTPKLQQKPPRHQVVSASLIDRKHEFSTSVCTSSVILTHRSRAEQMAVCEFSSRQLEIFS